MLLLHSAFSALLSFAAAAAAMAVAQDSLPTFLPWEITRLVVSGLPYRGDLTCHDLRNTIAVEIRDPNRYLGLNSSGSDLTQCITKFPYCSPPYNTRFSCTDIPYGNWTFTVSPGENADPAYWSPGQNFTLGLQLLLKERGVFFAAQPRFAVGDNLRGMCSAGGACSFGLKEEMVPLLVQANGPLM